MATLSRDLLNRIQDDAFGRLLANAWLSDVAIVKIVKGIPEAEIRRQLGALTGKTGKIGACILVLRPIAMPQADNIAGRSQVIQAFTALEHPVINASSQGTGKTAQLIAAEIFRSFQGSAASVPGQVFSGYPGGAIVPDDGFEGLNGWEVRMQMFAGLVSDDRVGTPLIDPDSGAGPQLVTITCGTAGANIFYTLDGSYPSSANAAAIPYAAPFNAASGALIRAAAESAGKQQSNIAEAFFD